MNTALELFHRHACGRQKDAVDILDLIGEQVVGEDEVVAHVDGLRHHVVEVDGLSDGCLYTGADQAAHGEDHKCKDGRTNDEYEGDGRRVVVDALRVEPFVAQLGDLSCLVQTGELIVNHVDEVFVIADEAQLPRGDVGVVGGQTVKVQFIDFPVDGLLAPEEIPVFAVAHTGDGLSGGVVFHLEGMVGVETADFQRPVVVVLDRDGIFL